MGNHTRKKLHKFDLDLNDMYAIYPQRLIIAMAKVLCSMAARKTERGRERVRK